LTSSPVERKIRPPRQSGSPRWAERTIPSKDDERKHLEGLLKDRINFHLIFASVFMAGLSRMDDVSMRRWARTAITAISLVIFMAVVRTFLLVREALLDIRACDPPAPYSRYYETVQRRFPFNASYITILVPGILTFAFGMATIKYWRTPVEQSPKAETPPAVYQIEDHSDRRLTTGREGTSDCGKVADACTAAKATKKTAKQPLSNSSSPKR
jgi:hypothetical protein